MLAIAGAVIGVISTSMNWVTSAEIVQMRANSGTIRPFPSATVPDLNLVGLCDSGWITSQDIMFAVAAFVFFAGTILAFYTSLGGLVQVVGYATYYSTFDAAEAAVVSGLPSGGGPKLALISVILVLTSLLFPVFIWSKVRLKSIWRRFLSVTPEKNVRQEVPVLYAAVGSVTVLWGQVVWSSSAYGEGTVSAVLFTVAGFVLLAAAMGAIVLAWKTD